MHVVALSILSQVLRGIYAGNFRFSLGAFFSTTDWLRAACCFLTNTRAKREDAHHHIGPDLLVLFGAGAVYAVSIEPDIVSADIQTTRHGQYSGNRSGGCPATHYPLAFSIVVLFQMT